MAQVEAVCGYLADVAAATDPVPLVVECATVPANSVTPAVSVAAAAAAALSTRARRLREQCTAILGPAVFTDVFVALRWYFFCWYCFFFA